MATIYRWGTGIVHYSDGRMPIGDGQNAVIGIAQPLVFYSSSENDVAGGRGANTLLIEGNSSDGTRIVETISLNGQEKVLTKNSFLYLDRVKVIEGFTNMGIISITRSDGKLVGTIGAGKNGLYKAEYYTGKMESLLLSIGASVRATGRAEPVQCTLALYEFGRRIILHTFFLDTHGSTNKECTFGDGLPINPNSLLVLEAEVDGMNIPMSGWMVLRG